MKPAPPLPPRATDFVALIREKAVGRENALKARQLADFGYDERECRALVHAANDAGILIIADDRGYYVPTESLHVDRARERLRSQGTKMLARDRQLEQLAIDHFAEVSRTEGRLF